MPDPKLLDAARQGDERAFQALIEPHHSELHAHCYRMLGSVHDAEDALQDALLRAWKAIPRFGGEQLLRPWLYKIATNTCLDSIARRPKRVLPVDLGPAADPLEGPGQPLVESVWIEPYPDERIGVEEGLAGPEASYEQREAVELAFIAALQHLPAQQRAVLIMREVLGFSAREAAELLDTTVASVNSGLQRARKSVEERLPARSQQATLRALADDELAKVVESYMEAMASGDIDRVVRMLTDDATWSMPPATVWYRGLGPIRAFLGVGPLSGEWRWRHAVTRASGQPAIGAYTWDEDAGLHRAFALDVLTLEGDRIREITSFIVRTPELPDRDASRRWPDHPDHPGEVESVFQSFGLPPTLD